MESREHGVYTDVILIFWRYKNCFTTQAKPIKVGLKRTFIHEGNIIMNVTVPKTLKKRTTSTVSNTITETKETIFNNKVKKRY